MTDCVGSFFRRAVLAACLALLVAPASHAQEALKIPPPTSMDFMTRFDFHMSAAGLSSEDPRFSWDTHWGGDFDFLDYVFGRFSFLADYEAVLGKENRLFDPNHAYPDGASGQTVALGERLQVVLDRQRADGPSNSRISST